jgi:glycosyltransferase involved in cell wall biosynthesis
MTPFISIVTVSLNAAATVEDTIASVQLQDVPFGIEHICVDGGSSDATRECIDRWIGRSVPVRRVYEPDEGIFDAMNKGLRVARGEYVLFLNADDFLVARNTLRMAMDGLTPGSPSNPDLVVGDVSMGMLGRRGIWRHRRVPRLLGRLRGFGLFPVHQGQFTKRRLLDAIGGFEPGRGLGADVLQFYDLEREFNPTLRRVRSDIAFMRSGGASNANARTMYKITAEFYRHLSSRYPRGRAAVMVIVKTAQSLTELRYGTCPHRRWFIPAPETSDVQSP